LCPKEHARRPATGKIGTGDGTTEGFFATCWDCLPDGVWVGSGVSQVQAAFVTTPVGRVWER